MANQTSQLTGTYVVFVHNLDLDYVHVHINLFTQYLQNQITLKLQWSCSKQRI